MREILDCKKCTLPSCSKMSKFSLAPYSNVLWDLEQCPKSKLGLSLLVPKQPGEDRGGEEGLYDTLVHSGRRWWGCGGLEGSYLPLSFSSQLLLMKFYSSVHSLPPSCVLCILLWTKLPSTLLFVRRPTQIWLYIPDISRGTLRLMYPVLNKALRGAHCYYNLVSVQQQWCRTQFGEELGTRGHTSQFKQSSFVPTA